MKFSKMLPAAVRGDDHPKVVEAIDAFIEASVDVRRPDNAPCQLKIAWDLSFYPTTGAIVRDGPEGRLPQKGLHAAIDLAKGYVSGF